MSARVNQISSYLFHLDERLLEFTGFFSLLLNIFLEIVKRYFVAALKFTIFLSLFLYGIVCEMNELIVEVLERKLFACCADIPIIIPVTLYITIYTCYEDIASDVKFSSLVDVWIFDIFLNEKSSFRIYVSTLD